MRDYVDGELNLGLTRAASYGLSVGRIMKSYANGEGSVSPDSSVQLKMNLDNITMASSKAQHQLCVSLF